MRKTTIAAMAFTALAVSALVGCKHLEETPSHTINKLGIEQNLTSVPEPSELAVNIITAGRTTTLNNMDIVYVGKQIPYTYSANKIANSPDYFWWVSKHFAIKSDLPEHKVKLYLELLEMSYPHYAELFGAEPPNIERQRIAVVYGSSRNKLKESMLDDGFLRGVHKNAGGETMYYNRAGYSFPSSREQHQRYIVIHETMHAYQMALTEHSTWAPNWITEGLADSIAQHTYDPKLKQLTVMIRDHGLRPLIHEGLKQYYENGEPRIDEINDEPRLRRGLNFLITHFFVDDVERRQYFALFRDQLMAKNPHSEATLPTANKLLKDVFPDWEQIEEEFEDYVTSIKSSFYKVNGPWEQNGNSYWIRSYDQNKMARMDFLLPLNQAPKLPRYHIDFPASQSSPLVNKPSRGTQSTNVGLLIEYQPDQVNRGNVGLALGVKIAAENQTARKKYTSKVDGDKDSYLTLVIEQGRKLTIKGHNLDQDYQAFALAPKLKAAMLRSESLGVNVETTPSGLAASLKSENVTQTIEVALAEDTLATVKSGFQSLLAQNASHHLTPYFDDGRSSVDLLTQTAPNPWGYQNSEQLRRVFNTCKAKDTGCNTALDNIYTLVETQKHDQADILLNELSETLRENSKSLAMLTGVKQDIAYHKGKPFVRLVNPSNQPLVADVVINYLDKQGAEVESQIISHPIEPGTNNIALPQKPSADRLFITSNITIGEQLLTLTSERTVKPFDGVYLHSIAKKQGKKLKVSSNITGPYSGDTHGKVHFELLPTKASSLALASQDVSIKPYSSNDFEYEFVLHENTSNVTVEVRANLEVDGEAILLVEQLNIR